MTKFRKDFPQSIVPRTPLTTSDMISMGFAHRDVLFDACASELITSIKVFEETNHQMHNRFRRTFGPLVG